VALCIGQTIKSLRRGKVEAGKSRGRRAWKAGKILHAFLDRRGNIAGKRTEGVTFIKKVLKRPSERDLTEINELQKAYISGKIVDVLKKGRKPLSERRESVPREVDTPVCLKPGGKEAG